MQIAIAIILPDMSGMKTGSIWDTSKLIEDSFYNLESQFEISIKSCIVTAGNEFRIRNSSMIN